MARQIKPPKDDGTKLAEVQNPAKLTNADIQTVAKDDGSDDPENEANQDVAETLKDDRAAAKAKEDPNPAPHGQQLGASGI